MGKKIWLSVWPAWAFADGGDMIMYVKMCTFREGAFLFGDLV